MPDRVRVSVIIPVYNGAAALPASLCALQRQTCPPDEVIVVDDGSTDGSADVARGFGVCVISQRNAGPAAARNRGATVAQGDILLFTDADCVPAPDWVERMVIAFTDPAVAGAKGTYRTCQRELVARFVQAEYEDRYARMRLLQTIDFVDTYSAGYRRDVFLSSGGFDTSFPTASVEDQEFSFRLAEAGHRLVFVPDAQVFHTHDRTLGEYARRKFWIGYWKVRVVREHPDKLVRDSHTPQVLKVQILLLAFGGLERAVFQQHLVADPDFPDVMEQCRIAQGRHLAAAQSQFFGDEHGKLGHPVGMAGRQRVSGVNGRRQGADGAVERDLQFFVEQ